MTVEIVIGPEQRAAAEECERALVAARDLSVTDLAQYQAAAEELRKLSTREKFVDGMRVDMKARPLEECRQIDAWFKEPLKFLSDAKKLVSRAMGAYDEEQRRLREEAERQAAEAARKERERQEAEAAKIAEAARLKREKEEAKARELEAAGRAEKAEALRQKAEAAEAQKLAEAEAQRQAAAAIPAAPVVHIPQPKAEGVSSRQIWKYEIVDKDLLPREYTLPDDKAIGGVVRALKDKTNIPGVRVYSENTYATRGA